MSSFTWIDSSSEERRRVLDAIETLKDSESRDELGLGTIRDGFANALFPGTGTLQTRAGYFLFVPWVYQLLHRRKVTHESVEALGRKEELRLVAALLSSDDTDGVIGKVSRDRLKRLPSSVYWSGLRAWRIFENDLTIDEYHRQFERFREPADGVRDDDQQLVAGSTRRDWHAALPQPPEDFPRVASFALRKGDRDYLVERITLSAGSSLLAWLVRHGTTLEADAPWDHPQHKDFPAPIQETLRHAQCFSDAMHGAAYLYNLMLSEELPAGEVRDGLVTRYRSALEEWSGRLARRRGALADWSLASFWDFTRPLMRVPPATQQFIGAWVALRGWEQPDGLADSTAARTLVRNRERDLKRARARLGNAQALALWGHESGTARLVFRWFSARRILLDLRPELAAHARP